MKENFLSQKLLLELENIYEKLQEGYEEVSQELGLSCMGCPDNCCDSPFFNHTYLEWEYLWLGIKRLAPQRQQELISRAQAHIAQRREALNDDHNYRVMCPLHEDGRCVVYKYRLLICRIHGVPAIMTKPDGQTIRFPGCFRAQEIVADRYWQAKQPPYVDRTILFGKLALLEGKLLQNKNHTARKIKITVAEMLVKGPPGII